MKIPTPTPSSPIAAEAYMEMQLTTFTTPKILAPLISSSSSLDLLVEAIVHVPSIPPSEPSLPLPLPISHSSSAILNPWEDFRQAFCLVCTQES